MDKVRKTDAEWQAELDSETYRITRQKGTEAPFSGEYCETKIPGMYRCACCNAPLFDSAAKYESHSGWPSFWQPAAEAEVDEIADTSHGMRRVEVTCHNCGAHLGHVFPDGPQPTGQRYCINSAALELDPKAKN